MRILLINKFLHPNGGSETYIFKLGDYLKNQGHEVQYFGMEHEARCVGNAVNSYTSNMDFHGGSKFSKLAYPVKTIYSHEARKKLRLVLNDFKPDVCHINNFNYQLTPSIILEIVSWRKRTNRKCRIVFTAHDYQLICPNHMLNNPNTHENCEKCLGGHFINCTRNKCIHGSMAKSVIGTMEAEFWKWNGVYRYIDTMVCCSRFMKEKMDSNSLFKKKTIVLHNFVDKVEYKNTRKKDYVLYFGRFSEEKGIGTLLNVCKELPDVSFVFAGTGPLEEKMNGIPNVRNVGFQTGEALKDLIREARFSVYPSEWYENCPFSVMESQIYGTPVLGSDIGGIPELIDVNKTGQLFEPGNAEQLKQSIRELWDNPKIVEKIAEHCGNAAFDDIVGYCEKMIRIYSGGVHSIAVHSIPRYILYFGRYAEEKGIRTFIAAAQELSNILFICAGKGPLEKDLFHDKQNNVINVGYKFGIELAKLIAYAQFVIVPSEWHEPFGLSIIEAMQLGTVVIGSDRGAIEELIRDGENGLIFKAGDKAELVKRIHELWNSPQQIKVFSDNCKKTKIISLQEYGQRIIKEIYVVNDRREITI